ncbi:MAG: CHC2 zinc finger domain-containing protein [bacterium]
MSSVEQIKERLNIEDVIGSYIKLEKAGNNLKAKCPFHNEKTPSFFVSPERGSYYCFGCQKKGDVFTFVQEFEGIDFLGALKILADKAGITLEKFASKTIDKKERLYQLLETATLFLQKNLESEKIPFDYLKKRGLNDETIKNWKIGYVKNEWRTISDYLKSKNFTDEEIEKAGISKTTLANDSSRSGTEGKNTYDRFRGRIMFPIFDSAGRVIAFSGRILHDLPAPRPGIYFVYAILCGNNDIYIGQTEDLAKRLEEHRSGNGAEHTEKFGVKKVIHYEEFSSREEAVKRESDLKTGFGRKWLKREWEAGRTRQAGDGQSAKYLNSPQTELFDKSKVLYGFDKAKQAIRKFNFSILVEGQMDLLMAHQAGFTNTVASSGTALSNEHLALLKRISNNIIMSFDSDDAGAKAIEKNWALALFCGMDVKIAEIPKGYDPADLILENKDRFKNLIKNSIFLIDFLLNRVETEILNKKKLWENIKIKILPYIYLLDGNTERSHYIKKISDLINIKENFIWDDLKKIKLDEEFQIKEQHIIGNEAIEKEISDEVLKKGSIERSLASIIIKQEGLSATTVAQTGEKIDTKIIWDNIENILGEEKYLKFKEETKTKIDELAFEAEGYYEKMDEKKLQKEIKYLILNLREEYFKKELEKLLANLKMAEKEKTEETINCLSIRLKEIMEKLSEIRIEKQKK